MLKRLLDLMVAAEDACRRAIGEVISSPGACDKPTREDYDRAIEDPGNLDFGLVFTYAVLEGISEENAFAIGTAYARKVAEGVSRTYALVYATAYSIACAIIGATEEWSQSYAEGWAHAIAARESMDFAAVYGHAIADGASPEEARVFAGRYAT